MVLMVMTYEEEKEWAEKELEKVFTVDGRGRPAKAKLFLELVANYGSKFVLDAVEKIGQRKNF